MMETYHDRIGTSDAYELPIEAVRYVIRDVDYMNILGVIEQMEWEIDEISGRGDALGAFGTEAIADIEGDIATKIIDAGLRISSIVLDFDEDLTDWGVRAREVAIEITSARLDQVREAALGGVFDGDEQTTMFVLAQDWQYWPFEGEYWADEVDNYRGDLPMLRDPETNSCVATELPL